ncbi:MAG: bifunctional diaminohydroxyphosphoribosylaminopyrimidine deaminase/5-amino-6-(5-phosphoribosylamino)uracil reductase RibD [Neisseriaceae bacterium]|nr:bifunctional diaminohydroxyphosphoribosylaminopyrimidine deaminase/5-amino-6-(5-phosphoribosylamino)uracil reductase RibD [Neisseriaceae bacterium]
MLKCNKPFSVLHQSLMQRALALAEKGRFTTHPNPRVGCVIAQGSHIVGEGYHLRCGEPHAEIFALKEAKRKAKGATVYVTLEPCAHFGKTPPCAEALIQAGVARVIVATQDPNPQVAGKGIAMLQEAGIKVSCGLLEKEARALNLGFLSRFEKNRPYIRLKYAQSLDGKIALNNGQSQWITGEVARADVHHYRAQSSAILTGVNTILADNPLLNARIDDIELFRQPERIILDSHLRTPLDAQVITDETCHTVLVTLEDTPHKDYPQHIEIMRIPANTDGKIDLSILMTVLAQRGVNEIWTEAGSILNSALLQEHLVDEIVVYQAPMILGNTAKDIFRLPEYTDLTQIPRWGLSSVKKMGDDIRIILRHAESIQAA